MIRRQLLLRWPELRSMVFLAVITDNSKARSATVTKCRGYQPLFLGDSPLLRIAALAEVGDCRQRRLWVLGYLERIDKADCQTSDVVINSGILFALALKCLSLGCATILERAKAFLREQWYRICSHRPQ